VSEQYIDSVMYGATIKGFLVSKNRSHRQSGIPSSHSMGAGISFPGVMRPGSEVEHLRRVSRLRMPGALLLLILYAFMNRDRFLFLL